MSKSELKDLYHRIDMCRSCDLIKLQDKPQEKARPRGTISKTVLLGIAPGKVEVEQERYFVGPAGKLLQKMLKFAGFKDPDDELYFTNPVKCQSKPEDPESSKENVVPDPEYCKKCVGLFLKKELQIIQPKILVFLGKVAASTLLETGESVPMGELLGKQNIELECREWVRQLPGLEVVMGFYHPSFFLRGKDNDPVFQRAKDRQWEQLQELRRLV